LAPDVLPLLPWEGLMLFFATTLAALQLSDIHGQLQTTLLLLLLATAPATPKQSSITGLMEHNQPETNDVPTAEALTGY
jgi:hypothetical protein